MKWVAKSPTNPYTRQPLSVQDVLRLSINEELENTSKTWERQHPEYNFPEAVTTKYRQVVSRHAATRYQGNVILDDVEGSWEVVKIPTVGKLPPSTPPSRAATRTERQRNRCVIS